MRQEKKISSARWRLRSSLTLVSLAVQAAAQLSGPTTARGATTILIRNATVAYGHRGTLAGASVLVRDGKIAAVGTNVQAPSALSSSTRLASMSLPEIIDCHSHIAVQET